MENELIRLFTKYSKNIMEITLGSSKDREGYLYTDVYSNEWGSTIEDLSSVIVKMYESKIELNEKGITYMFLYRWSNVMIFDNIDLDMSKLERIMSLLVNEFICIDLAKEHTN